MASLNVTSNKLNHAKLQLQKGIPLYVVGFIYIAFSLVFPDRLNYISGFAFSLILWLGSRAIGRILFNQVPDSMFFPAGLGIVLTCSTLISVFTANLWCLTAVWILVATASVYEARYLTVRLPWKYIFIAPFVLLAFWSSFTPTTFYDAVAYHLGLPFQYLANGKVSVLGEQLYSTFPPFEQVMNLLFAGFQCLSGIKLFSLILYFGLFHVLAQLMPESESWLDSKFVLWILAVFPSPWILIHIMTADLLASLFFCCAVATIVRYASLPFSLSYIFPAIFVSFGVMTKINCLLYSALLSLLWLILKSDQTSREKGKKLLWQTVLVLLFLTPLLLRNYISVGDPLFPGLKAIFPESTWTIDQQRALRFDSFSHRENILLSIIQTPFLLTFRKGSFGAAAEPGLAFLFGILGYFFVRKHPLINRILFYSLVCYVLWLLIFYSFRQFLPVFFLFSLPAAIAIHALNRRSKLIFYASISIFAFYSVLCLLPIFLGLFPLIGFKQTQTRYLRMHLDYYPAVEKINRFEIQEKILFVGETRSAYLEHQAIVASPYNYNPLFEWVSHAKDSDELLKQFKRERVQFIFCNWREYRHVAGKSGLWPIDLLPPRFANDLPANGIAVTGKKLAKMNDRDRDTLREFLSRYAVLIWQHSDFLYIYEIRFLDPSISPK